MIDFVAAPATLPPGHRAYAIGDVHGCMEQLAQLHRAIAEDLAARPVDAAVLIHLGDYVDRGPDSAAVVQLLAAGPPIPGVRTVNLMGNHEHMMLDAVASGESTRRPSYGWPTAAPTPCSAGACRASVKPTDWAGRIPRPHLVFLRDLTLRHAEGPYLFVHAGIRPGVPSSDRARQDLLWIREPFLSSKGEFLGEPGMVVVHGHTPSREPVVRPNRIGIDTGAVMGGVLTCAVLEDDRVGFLASEKVE